MYLTYYRVIYEEILVPIMMIEQAFLLDQKPFCPIKMSVY